MYYSMQFAKQPPSAAFPSPSGEAPPSAAFLLRKNKIVALPAPQMVLALPQGHEDSEYVLSFEIGQR